MLAARGEEKRVDRSVVRACRVSPAAFRGWNKGRDGPRYFEVVLEFPAAQLADDGSQIRIETRYTTNAYAPSEQLRIRPIGPVWRGGRSRRSIRPRSYSDRFA